MGEINDTVRAKGKIELYPPGRITGVMQAPVVLIESGVVFNGNCFMRA
jgi:cytoskeletal protein CcmA (bactofilin family)